MSNFPKGSGAKCSVLMCQNEASPVSQYCPKHKQRVIRTGHPTTPAINLRRTEGKKQRLWLEVFIEDELKTNESLGESLAWLKAWVSQQARHPSKGQAFFRRVYAQVDEQGYISIVAGIATLIANNMFRPSSIESGLPLIRQTATWALFGAVEAPYTKKKRDGKVSTAYYVNPSIADSVGKTILEEMGKDLSYLAQRAVRLSPYFNRKKGL